MQLLKLILSGGNVHDSEAALALLPGIELGGKKILTDKAYSCEQATASKDFFKESRITVTLPRATTNWLFALRISFYSLLLLFTFNLPIATSKGEF